MSTTRKKLRTYPAAWAWLEREAGSRGLSVSRLVTSLVEEGAALGTLRNESRSEDRGVVIPDATLALLRSGPGRPAATLVVELVEHAYLCSVEREAAGD